MSQIGTLGELVDRMAAFSVAFFKAPLSAFESEVLSHRKFQFEGGRLKGRENLREAFWMSEEDAGSF